MDLHFLSLTKILEERKSKINGQIRVIRDVAFGTHIQVNGLTQSGGIVQDIWRSTLNKIRKNKYEIRNCLILGLGGGSAAVEARKFWPKVKITGVEIDPIMVELGKKYLSLDKSKVKIILGDALEYLRQNTKYKIPGFDLILVDLYVGDEFPEKFESDVFLRLISDSGMVVFNRLYYGNKRPDAMRFGKKLEKVFSKVDYIYPEANLMLICQK